MCRDEGTEGQVEVEQENSLRTVPSIQRVYIHLYYLYVCGFVNKSTIR